MDLKFVGDYKKREKFKDIPIIFVTALEDANKLAEALDMGQWIILRNL